ncbi:MAG: flagellar hook-associated protein FlgK [Ilumatobacteraceae bacterium]
MVVDRDQRPAGAFASDRRHEPQHRQRGHGGLPARAARSEAGLSALHGHRPVGLGGRDRRAVAGGRSTRRRRVRRSGASHEFYTTRSQIGFLAEDVFGEPDNGINTALDTLFDSFAAWSTTPTDAAARAQVLSGLQNFAGRANDVLTGLDGIDLDAHTRLHAQIKEINALSERVAEINTFARTPGGLPADLNDELQLTLDRLSNLAGASAETQPDGRIRVTINGWALVDADRATVLQVPDSPPGSVLHPSGDIQLGGSAGGLQQAITGDIAGFRDKLVTFVSDMADTMNEMHGEGYTMEGDFGGDLFEIVDNRVNVLVQDPAELAASADPDGPLGATVADNLAQMRSTLGSGFRDVVTNVSNQIASLDRSATTAAGVHDASVAVRDSVLGVNLDEEMTNLITQQRAYEAAARVISIVDEMMQTLLAM